MFDASYLVLGLGDVYLGAPVATPLDPRHRLVTTKYNPARTWTPENAVGIGGAYLCIYGMEGPGGYQFVGRTVQVWNTLRADRAHFAPASRGCCASSTRSASTRSSAEELLDLRADAAAGPARAPHRRRRVLASPTTSAFLAEHARRHRRVPHRGSEAAFAEERAALGGAGEFDRGTRAGRAPAPPADRDLGALPDGAFVVEAPLHGNVCAGLVVAAGDASRRATRVVMLEAMKMEIVGAEPRRRHGARGACATVGDARSTPGTPLVVVIGR